MTKKEAAVVQKAYNAIRAITLTPALRDWLEVNDPKAMYQLLAAEAELSTSHMAFNK